MQLNDQKLIEDIFYSCKDRWVHDNVRAPSKAPVVSLSKKLYPYCLVLVGSRNRFERDFTITK